MLRAQEDINRFSTTTLLSASDGTCSYQRGITLRGVWGDKHEDMLYFLSGGNVMILDAMNQKQAT